MVLNCFLNFKEIQWRSSVRVHNLPKVKSKKKKEKKKKKKKKERKYVVIVVWKYAVLCILVVLP